MIRAREKRDASIERQRGNIEIVRGCIIACSHETNPQYIDKKYGSVLIV